jgi:PPK2 family polyphosphate:nucleotide phosphotransferase
MFASPRALVHYRVRVTGHGERWIRDLVAPLRVEAGRKVELSRDFDPQERHAVASKQEGLELLARGVEQLAGYQARLYAQDAYGVLVVLQALDAAGKDGTIRHVMSGVNPQGVVVHPFKVPSLEELDHDYLWRYAQRLPRRGQIGIFNRSHYEEVLVVRVHQEFLTRQRLPPGSRDPEIWKRRFREINDWERYLVENGIKVVKLFLNLSKEEQRRRFLRRIDLPDHNWKFSAADVQERRRWDEYQHAFSEMLSHTSTTCAPWHVIPADRKWYARLCASAVLLEALSELDPRYPELDRAARDDLQRVKAALEAEAPVGTAADPVESDDAPPGP